MNSEQPDFSQLPLEIIVKILSYLGTWDIKSAMQTCRQWLSASQFPEIQEKTILKLTDKIISKQYIFTHSLRKFPHIYLHKLNSSLNYIFTLPNIYKTTESIAFDCCYDLTLDKFVTIIENMENLKALIFVNVALQDYAVEIKDEKKLEKFQNRISKLKSLTFVCREKFEIVKFCSTVKLFCNMKNLEIFKIIDISITQSVFETDFKNCLYQIIKRNSKTLKELHLPYLFSKDDFLKSLNLMNGLQLKTLKIQYLELKWKTLDKFLSFQNQLLGLNLSNAFKITDNDIEIIVENLKLLECINIQDCRLLTNKSLIEIAKLKRLKGLKINNNGKFTSDGILNGIVKEQNLILTQLYTLGVSFNEITYIKIAENLPNIQRLHIGSRSINDKAIQAIIKNCTELIDLNLFESAQITDYGLTGIDQFDTVVIRTGYSIANLNKLKNLNLRRCSKITDCTLINGFKFPNLKVLHLPSCFPFLIALPWLKIRKISIPGFEAFVKNCPNIEELNLLGCSGYENLDIGISIALKELKYLKTVKIARRCERKVKDQKAILKKGRRDLSYININCRCMTCINIRKCCEEFFDEKSRWVENLYNVI